MADEKTCKKCGMSIGDGDRCGCEPEVCYHCCECGEDCRCGCHQK